MFIAFAVFSRDKSACKLSKPLQYPTSIFEEVRLQHGIYSSLEEEIEIRLNILMTPIEVEYGP